MFDRIRHMLIKEFIQVFRDPRMRTVIFVIPCIQTIVIGYAVTLDVRDVPTAVYDLDNTADSRELTARFVRSRYFRVVQYVDNGRRARELIDRGGALEVARGDQNTSPTLADPRGEFAASGRLPCPLQTAKKNHSGPGLNE